MDSYNDFGARARGKKMWLWIIIIVLVVGGGSYFAVNYFKNKSNTGSDTSGEKVTIPQKVLDNKFGWLGGGADDTGDTIIERGGAWVRPHPGAFVWDMMQKSKDGAIDFTLADEEISNFQKNNLGILATIWPFAEWDQQNLADAKDCAVAANDEFLPKNDKKGRGSYLPEHRCNPSDWTAYQSFVAKVVERYDGDGIDDMPGLSMPVKYWEVMNEPDLQYQSTVPLNATNSLNFYKQGPAEYAELLIKTSGPIRSADPEAKILIAGAAGAESRMLSFFKEVFQNDEVAGAFDIGNIHCISNDQKTSDFNVALYKNMFTELGITGKPIWVTEAEAMYSKVAEENFQSTKKSTEGAVTAGAERLFFTRYEFDDIRTDMSKTATAGTYPSAEKYREIIESFLNIKPL